MSFTNDTYRKDKKVDKLLRMPSVILWEAFVEVVVEKFEVV